MKELEIAAQEELIHCYSSSTVIISTYGEPARIEKCEPFFFSQEAMINMFRKGAAWQAKQMAWINVNNKMPEDGIEVDEKTILAHTKNVIVLYKNGCVGKGKRIYINNKKGWQWSCLKGEDITHWMNYPN